MFNDKIILRSQQRFRSDHHRVYTEEVNKIALSSNDDKRNQTHDKIITYLYGSNIFKICENEMLLKNKFDGRLNNEAQIPKNELHELRNESQALINNFQITRNELQALRNNSQIIRDELHKLSNEAHIIKNNSEVLRNGLQALRNNSQLIRDELHKLSTKVHIIKNNSQVLRNNSQALRNKAQAPKNKSWIIRNELHELRDNSQALRNEVQSLRNNSKVIRDELHGFMNEAHVFKNNSQALRNKAQVPKNKSRIIKNKEQVPKNKSWIIRNESQVLRNESQSLINDAFILEIMIRLDLINKVDKTLFEVNIKVTHKVKSIYNAMCELQDEIYNDPYLILVELNKIEYILDDALNIVSKEIYGKNRISSKIINIDKDKDIDGYISKLTDVINNKIKLINKIGETIDCARCEINNETNMINELIHKASVMDNDTLYLIDDKLNKIITQTRKKK